MNPNLKKWLLSGTVFILAGAILIAITLALSFIGSFLYQYIMFPALCILAGYIIIRILNKIDSITVPTLANTNAKIFAIYSTIITSILIIMAQIITKLDEAMQELSEIIGQGTFVRFFGDISPAYVALVAFIGLNVAYWYDYHKRPDKNWKDFIPHIIGAVIILMIFLTNPSRIVTG
jgi:hypothetical protein